MVWLVTLLWECSSSDDRSASHASLASQKKERRRDRSHSCVPEFTIRIPTTTKSCFSRYLLSIRSRSDTDGTLPIRFHVSTRMDSGCSSGNRNCGGRAGMCGMDGVSGSLSSRGLHRPDRAESLDFNMLGCIIKLQCWTYRCRPGRCSTTSSSSI